MIKVGQFVTYRPRPNALGVTGCQVLELGETIEGQLAARLDMGQFGIHNVLVEHLHPEDDLDATLARIQAVLNDESAPI